MAREQATLSIPYGQWVELTNDDVTHCGWLVLEGSVEIVLADEEPAEEKRGWLFDRSYGWPLSRALTDLTTSSGARVWAKGAAHPLSKVIVDHA